MTNADEHVSEVFLDATGLACPMPLLKLKQQINRLLPGQTVRIDTTDPGSVRDIEAFCKQAGHHLLALTQHVSERVHQRPDDLSNGGQIHATPAADAAAIYSFVIRKRVESVN